jgi:hypothetical protein
MSTNGNPPTTNTPITKALEAGPPAVLLSPDDAILQLRALQEQMPQMEPNLSTSRSLRGQLQHVNPLFITAAVGAVGTSDVVQSALGRTDEALREQIDLAARWFAVADQARAVLRQSLIIGTVLKQRVGLAALQTYKICQQLDRDVVHAKLSTHVAEMKRLNKFGRVRRRPTEPELPPETAAKAQS